MRPPSGASAHAQNRRGPDAGRWGGRQAARVRRGRGRVRACAEGPSPSRGELRRAERRWVRGWWRGRGGAGLSGLPCHRSGGGGPGLGAARLWGSRSLTLQLRARRGPRSRTPRGRPGPRPPAGPARGEVSSERTVCHAASRPFQSLPDESSRCERTWSGVVIYQISLKLIPLTSSGTCAVPGRKGVGWQIG